MTDTSDEHVVRVNISDAEIVELLSERTSQLAVTRALERVNYVMAGLGLLGALFAGASLLFIDQRIETQLKKRLPVAVSEEVSRNLSDALDLPLLVAEAVSWNSGGVNIERADIVIESLERLSPTIMALDARNKKLALNRIEAILDIFWEAGDYERLQQTYNSFGPTLLQEPGIYTTMSHSVASMLIIGFSHGNEFEALLDTVLSVSIDPASFEFDDQRLLWLISQSVAANDDDTIVRLISEEAQRFPEFPEMLGAFLYGLDNEMFPGDDGNERGRNYSVTGWETLERLKTAHAIVASAAQ